MIDSPMTGLPIRGRLLLTSLLTIVTVGPATADHRVLLQGDGRLAIVEPDGRVSWEMPWGGIHDIHLLTDGNILTREGRTAVVEIDRESKQVVWTFDRFDDFGNHVSNSLLVDTDSLR